MEERRIKDTFVKLGYYMLFGNGPWLVATIATTFLGYYIVQSFSIFEVEEYLKMTIPTIPLSMLFTSWLQVIFTKKIIEYNTLKKLYSARSLIKRMLVVSIILSLIYMLFFVVVSNFFIPIYDLGEISIITINLLVLNILWTFIAPLNGLQKYKFITFAFFVGITINTSLTLFFVIYKYDVYSIALVNSVGYAISSMIMAYSLYKMFSAPYIDVKLTDELVSKILEYAYLRSDGEKLAELLPSLLKIRRKIGPDVALLIMDKAEVSGGKGPSIISMVKSEKILLLTNLLYFLFIWTDRFFIWLSGVNVASLFPGINTIYEAGINIAQWTLIPSVGIAVFFMGDFTRRFIESVDKIYEEPLDSIEKSISSFFRIILRRGLTLVLSTAIIAAMIYLSKESILDFFAIEYGRDITEFVLSVGLISTCFHILLIYLYLVFMYLNRIDDDFRLFLMAEMTSLIVAILMFGINIYYVVFGYLAGTLVSSIFGILRLRQTIYNIPKELLSRAM
ncbi:MAG: exopolysaccharide Pel transporter PelG [Candidatus Asgardarchaeia archaeon]